MADKKGYVKREKRAFRRSYIPRKSTLANSIEPMAIALLEAGRHRNQLCRFNHHISIDSRGRWLIDGEVIREDPAADFIKAARGLYKHGFRFIYMRNHPTLTAPDGEPISITLDEAKRFLRR